MKIELTCPNCSTRLRISTTSLEKEKRCPKCGTLIGIVPPVNKTENSKINSPHNDGYEGKIAKKEFTSSTNESDSEILLPTRSRRPILYRLNLGIVLLAIAIVFAAIAFSFFYYRTSSTAVAKNNSKSDNKNLAPDLLNGVKTIQKQSDISRAPISPDAVVADGGTLFAAGAYFTVTVLVFVLVFGLVAIAAVFIIRDARSRAMPYAFFWMLTMATSILIPFYTIKAGQSYSLTLFGVLVFAIYLFARPQGRLTRCVSCRNKKLIYLAACPHCKKSTEGQLK